jgi:dihydrofolate synthase/folylpolyglutamate synthase
MKESDYLPESKPDSKNTLTPQKAPDSKKIHDFENWLDSFLNFEKLPQKNMFWLDTMEYLSEKAGKINKTCPAVHIAGSKGKGSTSAFIASILEEAGYKTGLYTSPHILSFLERITQNQKFLSAETYEKSAEELKNLIESASTKEFLQKRPVTWFELVTLYSFFCFKNSKMDVCVFETGLGGRLDATNVILPEICAIGPIELEHTEFLGSTVEKIAAEKAGIIKENTPVVVAEQKESVKEVFRKAAAQKNAEILFIDEICSKISTKIHTLSEQNLSNFTQEVEIQSPLFKRPLKTRLLLPGEFQSQNAALAAVCVKKAFPSVTEEQIEKGLSKTTLPARFEIIKSTEKYKNIPYVIVDGAHTVKSINFTMQTLNKITGENSDRNRTLLFACAKDKDAEDIVPLLKNEFNKYFLTKPGNVKQSDLTRLKNAFNSNDMECDLDEDYTKQIQKALDYCEKTKSILLVTGSFYLAAEFKKIFI